MPVLEDNLQWMLGDSDGVPWNEWEASELNALARVTSDTLASELDYSIQAYNAAHTRFVDPARIPRSALVRYLYEVCDKYDIDKKIAYNQINQESSFQWDAAGAYCRIGAGFSKCALGVAQFIPDTARSYGLKINTPGKVGEDDRLDPFKSLAAYGALMRDLLAQFDGDYTAALASYNAGSGTVMKAMSKAGSGWLARMPSETKRYVVKILGDKAADPATLAEVKAMGDGPAGVKTSTLLMSEAGPGIILKYGLYVFAVLLILVAVLPSLFRGVRVVKDNVPGL